MRNPFAQPDRHDSQLALDRRRFLAATGSLAAAAVWSSRAWGVTRRHLALADNPFQIGVASGDPSPTGFVLWTRLAPKPLEGGGMPAEDVEVDWQVAEDEQFSKVVRKGTTVAKPDWAHTVHVEVDGLEPDRWYWYQFRAAGETSPKARSRTTPPLESTPERLRFAFASCQHWESGLYTAYEHMLKDDVDLVFHLGDYIYEGAGSTVAKLRKHVGPKLFELVDYRNRHAQYKTDPALQAMHAAAPWIVAWDDHEFENNCAGLNPEHPERTTPEKYKAQRANSYQAYYEHMPLRIASLPQGHEMLLYRRIPYGQLAEFNVLDTRQYRTDQPNGDGLKFPGDAVLDPQGTILGEAQRNWLFEGLGKSQSKWNVLAQQVMMARVDFKPGDEIGHSMDQWPGYEQDRRRVLKYLYDRKIHNPVVLTGDIHSNWANELIADFDDLGSQSVATEFVGTSISSGGDGMKESPRAATALAENPFVKFANSERGYVRCNVSPKEWKSDYQVVEYVTRPGAPAITRAAFVVEDGKPVLNKV
ncbi:MAG: alkaline phosphatase D family protein [Planctomycetaceae bacterium]|nr:alkaline phosphatase D family protein [Planctomycetaceae bacterium]